MKKYIISIVCGVCVASFVAPLYVGAINTTSALSSTKNYSIEELESLIAQLQKQLAEMKSGAQCFVANRDLSLGDGETEDSQMEVKRLQAILMEKGYLSIKNPTGYFGKITKSALANFQKDSGLGQSGEFDGVTREKMHTLRCKSGVLVPMPPVKVEPASSVKPFEKKVEGSTSVSSLKPVTSIMLYGAENKVKWYTEGYSKNGFKVVYSKTSSPTYPTRDGDQYIYLAEPTAVTTTLDAFAGSGTYYVRVCEYLGGACGVYSNQVMLTL